MDINVLLITVAVMHVILLTHAVWKRVQRNRFPHIPQRKVTLAIPTRTANSASKRRFWKQTFGITAH